MLLPPCPEEGHANLAEEIIRRRAEGATTTLMADHALMCLAKESGLLEQGPLGEGDDGCYYTTACGRDKIGRVRGMFFAFFFVRYCDLHR